MPDATNAAARTWKSEITLKSAESPSSARRLVGKVFDLKNTCLWIKLGTRWCASHIRVLGGEATGLLYKKHCPIWIIRIISILAKILFTQEKWQIFDVSISFLMMVALDGKICLVYYRASRIAHNYWLAGWLSWGTRIDASLHGATIRSSQ